MRVLFWYCEAFGVKPSMKTLEDAPDADPGSWSACVAAFVHVEPQDIVDGSSAETKLVKNTKWLARKWETRQIVLHSFTHLGEKKAEPAASKALIDRVQARLENAGYTTAQTPYGYFNDLTMKAPGQSAGQDFQGILGGGHTTKTTCQAGGRKIKGSEDSRVGTHHRLLSQLVQFNHMIERSLSLLRS
jgi:hypothetical protein